MKAIIFFTLLVFFRPLMASSCSCVPLNVSRSFNSANAVFKGEVIKIDTLITIESGVTYERNDSEKPHYRQNGMIEVQFRIIEAIKGITNLKYVSVFTNYQCCTCGFPFRLNASYVVYGYYEETILLLNKKVTGNQEELAKMAKQPSVILSTSICTRTTMACDSEMKEIDSFLKSQRKSR